MTFQKIGDAAARVVEKAGKRVTRKWDGAKILEPGIYSGIPLDAYHGDLCVGPSISSSGLRIIEAQTPAHYFARSYLNPKRIPEERDAALDFGKAAHTLLLGESGFREHYAIRPAHWSDWRTKEARAWREEMEGAGRTVLTSDQVEAIRGCADAMRAHPLIRQGILSGEVERSLIWKDEKTGIWLKSRPDTLPNADGMAVDLKTTTDASPHAIERAILSHNYAMQAGLTSMAFEAVLGIPMADFVFVFVEKEPPYAVSVRPLDSEWIYWSRAQVRRALNRFAGCVKTGHWPGYDTDTTISMPDWLRKRFEAEEKGGLIQTEDAA